MGSAMGRGQKPGNGRMDSRGDVELLCPACGEWRAGRAGMTSEDFTSGEASTLD